MCRYKDLKIVRSMDVEIPRSNNLGMYIPLQISEDPWIPGCRDTMICRSEDVDILGSEDL